jgi:hypothetical protein
LAGNAKVKIYSAEQMPKLDTQQIWSLVKKNQISAFTIDTTAFDSHQNDLFGRKLSAISQLNESNIKILFSAITLGEVRAHIAENADNAAKKARAAVRDFLTVTQDPRDRNEIFLQLGLNADYPKYAEDKVTKFVRSIGATELAIEPDVSIGEVVRRYFGSEPPFSARKPSEFPDAIALLSLEAWAKTNGGYVLAVSNDGDWKTYAEESPSIFCVERLSTAMNYFHPDSEGLAPWFAERLQAKAPALSGAIREALQTYVGDAEAKAESDFAYEGFLDWGNLRDWKLIEESPGDVIVSDNESMTIAFQVAATFNFRADFRFFAQGAADGEPIARASTIRDLTLAIEITATLPRRKDLNPNPVAVEVPSRRLSVDFGEVGPRHE